MRIKQKRRKDALKIALAGNPNVGKSTVFNQLTGLSQHTGNWTGKTVETAKGQFVFKGAPFEIYDLPGTYSLLEHSQEEKVARDFLCFQQVAVTVVVCDVTCLERNLNLALQILEITDNVVICLNFADEAQGLGIKIDLDRLKEGLGVSLALCSARSGHGLCALKEAIFKVARGQGEKPLGVTYPKALEDAVSALSEPLKEILPESFPPRWTALRLLDNERAVLDSIRERTGRDPLSHSEFRAGLEKAKKSLFDRGLDAEKIEEEIVSALFRNAERICAAALEQKNDERPLSRLLDRIFIGRVTGAFVMVGLLIAVLWLTVSGANYPSRLLSGALFWLEKVLLDLSVAAGVPAFLYEPLIFGVYRFSAWVISVMLPPMAIFFPLFTLLEDFGYLPRVAFNLDRHFKRVRSCGKQGITMCLGLACHAAGVVGCRIIDSPRERLIAVLTNCFLPCNGAFPSLITLSALFFAGNAVFFGASFFSAFSLTLFLAAGFLMTLLVSFLLSKTILKGEESSFALELPPYRRPRLAETLVRSALDRTVFVMWRALAVSAPAGLFLWLLANAYYDGASLLTHFCVFWEPLAKIMGLDGVIFAAFILSFPANETFIPIMMMAYTASGVLSELGSLSQLKEILLANGWTWATAVSCVIFCLFHWPCSTTLLTIKKETASLKQTAVSFILPTLAGMILCLLFTGIARIFGV